MEGLRTRFTDYAKWCRVKRNIWSAGRIYECAASMLSYYHGISECNFNLISNCAQCLAKLIVFNFVVIASRTNPIFRYGGGTFPTLFILDIGYVSRLRCPFVSPREVCKWNEPNGVNKIVTFFERQSKLHMCGFCRKRDNFTDFQTILHKSYKTTIGALPNNSWTNKLFYHFSKGKEISWISVLLIWIFMSFSFKFSNFNWNFPENAKFYE